MLKSPHRKVITFLVPPVVPRSADLYSQRSKWPYTAGTSPLKLQKNGTETEDFKYPFWKTKTGSKMAMKKIYVSFKPGSTNLHSIQSICLYIEFCSSSFVHHLQQFCEYHLSHLHPSPKLIQKLQISKSYKS